MRLTIVGKEIVDYPKKTGEQVRGVRLYYTCKSDKKGIEGLCAGAEYFSDRYSAYQTALTLPIGGEVDAYYNQRGYLDTLVPVPAASSPAAAPAPEGAAAGGKK